MRKKMNKKTVQAIMFILLAGLMLTPVFARGSKDDDSGGGTESDSGSGTESDAGNDSDKGKMREDSGGTYRDDNGNGEWDKGEKRWDNKDIQEAIKRVAEASAALEAAKKSGSKVEIKEVMETLNEAKKCAK